MSVWTQQQAAALAAEVDFAKNGLVPVIARDRHDGAILMLGYQNEEAFCASLTTGRMHYWSRSKGRLWMKGETSGHVQEILAVRVDCDADTLLFDVRQHGPGACHTGERTCFYREARPGVGEWVHDSPAANEKFQA